MYHVSLKFVCEFGKSSMNERVSGLDNFGVSIGILFIGPTKKYYYSI